MLTSMDMTLHIVDHPLLHDIMARLRDRRTNGTEIYTAALDRGLNDRKYILPGLGDFGDRLYGT